MGFLDKLKDLASKNKGAVDTAIEKAGDIVDSKTEGKYAQQVDFEFGEGGQDVEEHLSHRVGRVVDLAAKG